MANWKVGDLVVYRPGYDIDVDSEDRVVGIVTEIREVDLAVRWDDGQLTSEPKWIMQPIGSGR